MWRVFLLCMVTSLVHASLFDEDLYESVLQPELCETQLAEMSAFEFYDASFRVPAGVLTGNLVHFGNYYQCLDIRQAAASGPIEGKHCTVTIPASSDSVELLPGLPDLPDLPWLPSFDIWQRIQRGIHLMAGMSEHSRVGLDTDASVGLAQLQLGVCIPKSCSVDQALRRYFNSSLLRVDYTTLHCRLNGDKIFTPGVYVAVVIFSLLGLLTLLSTGYELRHIFMLQRDPKQLNELYSCFSVYGNTRRLFTFREIPGALTCVDGIRALSIMWIIIGHTLITAFMSNISNLLDMVEWYFDFRAVWLTAANIAVDTFFLLSGMLLVYTSVNKMTPSGLVRNLHMYYLNRLLRMFPILAAAVLLQASVFHHVTDGANWHFEATNVQFCRDNWWAALLHIQNYYNPQNECLAHTWYLSVDIQLHILSPLVLFWVLRSRRAGWAGVTIAVLASLTASTIFIFINNFPGSQFDEVDDNFFERYYLNTLTRAPVFVIGMFFGYVMHVCRNQKIHLPAWFVCVCWTVCFILLGCVLYVYHPMNADDVDIQLLNNLVNAFNRPLWGIAICWVIFACVHGYSGPLNWFLSLTVWKFMARISYAMYIFHYPMQFIKAAAVIAPVHFSIPNIILSYVNDLSITLLLSTVVCIVIDAPFSTLQRMLLGGGAKKRPPKKEKEIEDITSKNVDVVPGVLTKI